MHLHRCLISVALAVLIRGTSGFTDASSNPYVQSIDEKVDSCDYMGALKVYTQAVKDLRLWWKTLGAVKTTKAKANQNIHALTIIHRWIQELAMVRFIPSN